MTTNVFALIDIMLMLLLILVILVWLVVTNVQLMLPTVRAAFLLFFFKEIDAKLLVIMDLLPLEVSVKDVPQDA